MNKQSFSQNQANQQMPNGQPAAAPNQANAQPGGNQAQAQQANANANAPPQPDLSADMFSGLDNGGQFDMDLSLGFGDSNDMLDQFDFDQFLTSDGDGALGGFDANFAFDGNAIGSGVEGTN
jgi:hypothetical protein